VQWAGSRVDFLPNGTFLPTLFPFSMRLLQQSAADERAHMKFLESRQGVSIVFKLVRNNGNDATCNVTNSRFRRFIDETSVSHYHCSIRIIVRIDWYRGHRFTAITAPRHTRRYGDTPTHHRHAHSHATGITHHRTLCTNAVAATPACICQPTTHTGIHRGYCTCNACSRADGFGCANRYSRESAADPHQQ
jgi:hypothetical protein